MSRLTQDLAAALDRLTRLVLSQPIDKTADPKVTVRPVFLRGGRMYQLERFRDNKAFQENLDGESLLRRFENELDGRYRQALLVTETESAQYSLNAKGGYKRHGGAAPVPRPASAEGNNRQKQYLIPEGEAVPALVDLGVFTRDYRIVRAKYDKYRQINRFLELIDQAFREDGREELTVLDFGCGKSYLTFILYWYFAVKQGRRVKIIGYDLKADVVEHCNAVAEKYGYEGLRFVRADVSRDVLYDQRVDMVVTLHACDTATDYALRYAVEKGADYIFSVPCCQHEINLQMKKGGELDVFLRHGIVRERMAALLTDEIRTLVLEDLGYQVDVIEFVDLDNSPKNLMLRARRGGRRSEKGRALAREIAERYGFRQTLLELSS
ncbi:MAG: SAM-dependent methyltransferase [Oscillospiraceae bacterium]|nr:SAM-dependent methyltransferase [Oscillospiraceae bacterium]